MLNGNSRVLTRSILKTGEVALAGLGTAEARAAQAMLDTEASGGRYQRSVYELFAEMEEKDGHLYSVVQTRVNGILGLPRETVQTGTEKIDAFVETALAMVPRFEGLLRALLDGLAKGFAVVELIWRYDDRGRLIVSDWIAHPQEYFYFDERGRLYLLAPPFAPEDGDVAGDGGRPSLGRQVLPGACPVAPPLRKFMLLAFGRDARNPFGRGLCQRAYWYYWFKKNNLKFWAIYNEKFGAPTAVAKYRPGTSEEDRERLLEVLEALQTDAGVVIPESVSLELIDSTKNGDGGTFRAMADWCNDEMAKIVLGATLTSSEGRRSGSLALGSIHNAVRQDYIEADAKLLESVLNESLVRWLVDLNFGEASPSPRVVFDATPPADLDLQARIDRELVSLGVPIPLTHFYNRYNRPQPRDGERALTYDDSNLYQYHLRYGVLTINEVRQRLHLEPVAWGDVPFGGFSTGVSSPNGAAVPTVASASTEELPGGEAREDPSEALGESDPHEP